MTKKLTKSKAEEMLHDGTAHGKKLTKKQKRYFGMIAHSQDGISLLDPNSYTASSSPQMYETTPIFKNKDEHNNYYRNQLLEKSKGTGLYTKYLEYGVDRVGVNPDADALLAAMGGIPSYKQPSVSKSPSKKSRILDIEYNPKKTEGYRYNKNLPDRESITPSYQKGGIIEDNRGQWAHPGKVTKIGSNNITMKGVDYPVLGVSDIGDTKMMYPENDYMFNGSSVTEFPLGKSGIHIKKSHRGLLHKNLGVPEGEKIPASKLKIKSTDSPAVKKRKQFALNAKHWNKGQEGTTINPPLNDQLSEILLKNALLQERQFKRDSVNSALQKKYPQSTGQVSKGMFDYLKTEPKEYLQLDTNLLDEKRKTELMQKFGKKLQYGGSEPSMLDYYPEGTGMSNPMGSGKAPIDSQYGRRTDINQYVQGAAMIGSKLQLGNQDNNPSEAQRAVGQFGPWGALISQVSQIGTSLTKNNTSYGASALDTMVFDPAGSTWLNKDLSKEDRMLGGLFQPYGAYVAQKAKKEKIENKKKLDTLLQNAATSKEVNQPRRYVRPEDQLTNPNELYPSYGTGTNYLKDGGTIPYMEQGGELETYWGGEAETISENPFLPGTGETVLFNGKSHEDGGIGMKFGGSPVEVEGGEPAVKLNDGKKESLVVFGDMKIPSYGITELQDPKAKNKKFKNYIKDLSRIEDKQNKIVEKGTDIVNTTEVIDSFDKLKFSSGKAMIEGGNMKLKQIAAKKQIAADVQNAILETAEELGLKSDALAEGKFKKDRKLEKTAQYGNSISRSLAPEYELYGYKLDPEDQNRMFRDLMGSPTSTTIPANPPNKGGDQFNKEFAAARRRGDKTFIFSGDGKLKTTDLFSGKTKTITNPGTTNRDYIYLKDDIMPNVGATQMAQQTSNVEQIPQEDQNYGFDDAFNVINSVLPYLRPSNQLPLDRNQLSGEMYALSTNQLEPVQAQKYQPLLESVSDISLQDQMNANQADFNSLQRLTANNPAAQTVLAAQKYQANSSVLGEQFRLNQAQRTGVYNRNRGVLNDATLKNLAILDQQYVRQSTAKSNTKAVAQAALNSISEKIAKNKLENRTLGVYENLYNYRFDNKGRAINYNGLAQFNIDNGIIDVDKDGKIVVNEQKVKRDKNGMIINSTDTQRVTDKKRNGGIVKALKGY